MIITCQSCKKRYFLEEGTIPPEGRMVRCVACHKTWSQFPITSDISMLSLDKLEDVRSVPPRSQTGPKVQLAWKWLLFLLVAVTLFVGGYIGRTPLVSVWPKALLVYQKLGVEVEQPGLGLSFQDVTPLHHTENGQTKLIIKGEILNVSDRARLVQSVTITLSGSCKKEGWISFFRSRFFPKDGLIKNQCVLNQWKHSLPTTRLLPGERLSFETSPRTPPPGVSEIKVEF